jgi:transposase-like protein
MKASYLEVANYCRTGATIEEAAKRFNCSTATVRQACLVHGYKPVGPVEMKHKEIATWVKENNATLMEAMKHFQAGREKINDACAKYSVKLSRKQAMPPVSGFKILAGLIYGKRGVDLAEVYGVSKQRVDQVRKAAEEAGVFKAIKDLQRGRQR